MKTSSIVLSFLIAILVGFIASSIYGCGYEIPKEIENNRHGVNIMRGRGAMSIEEDEFKKAISIYFKFNYDKDITFLSFTKQASNFYGQLKIDETIYNYCYNNGSTIFSTPYIVFRKSKDKK